MYTRTSLRIDSNVSWSFTNYAWRIWVEGSFCTDDGYRGPHEKVILVKYAGDAPTMADALAEVASKIHAHHDHWVSLVEDYARR
ncbi:MAG TPA: hypothetical protein VLH56_19100 [Dissulfurispiraceae bacterium]|nr:hypothetical protein [Dissulfurispiraceae bacterium]